MTYYAVIKGRHKVASVETTTNGTVKAASGRFAWACGKPITTLNEWLYRHNMRTETAVGEHQVDMCRLELKPQKELPQ
jgi:hypothetical protein